MKNKKTSKSELAAKIMAYGATAAGLLAVAQPAEAAIVHSGTQNLPLGYPGNPIQNIDLNNDSTNDFKFWDSESDVTQSIQALNSNSFIQSSFRDETRQGPTLGHSDAANLPLNYIIQSNVPASSLYWNTGYEPVAGSGGSTGSFNNVTGYLGVRFHSNACQGANWNYGWIQFRNNGLNNSTIIDWAYEATCNTQILAGKIPPKVVPKPIPTMDQWGMLIMTGLLSGAAIYRMRKEKKEA